MPPVSPNSATISFTNTAQNASTYLWNFGDGTSSTLPAPTHTYASAGTYTVTQTVTNSTGSASGSGTINIGAMSMQISNIKITNMLNSAIYQKYIYIVYTDDAGNSVISTPVYISSTAITILSVPMGLLAPITDFSKNAHLYLYRESVAGTRNPTADVQLLNAGPNFTQADNYGFTNSSNYPSPLTINSGSGYYNQTFTVSWE
jgi:PKD repeat protein